MYHIETKAGGHDWQKQNLVTIPGRKYNYDILKCSGCGMVGKSKALGYIELKASYSHEKVNSCPGFKVEAKRVKITGCTAYGPSFANLTPGSEHEIIEPPAGENSKNDASGVWVMGVGQPVRVLADEYNAI